MPGKTFAAVVLQPPLAVSLLALLVLLPGRSLAGPPEAVSGRMVFVDKVADGLRKYRQERDPGKRIEWLTRLAPTRDPRVAVALGEALEWSHTAVGPGYPDPGVAADVLLHVHYVPAGSGGNQRVWEWWKRNKDDLRRRAKQLPQ